MNGRAERRRQARDIRKKTSKKAAAKLEKVLSGSNSSVEDAVDCLALIGSTLERKKWADKIRPLFGLTKRELERALAERERLIREDARDAGADATTNADILIAIGSEAELTCNSSDGYATIENKEGGQVTVPVKSADFRKFLTHKFYEQSGRGVADGTMQTAINTLEARAVHDGKLRPVYVRIARLERKLVLDLADASGRVVVVENGRWRIADAPPPEVAFVRPKGVLPLRVPKRGGSIKKLRRFLNLPAREVGERAFRLIIAWLIGALSGRKPYPVLVFYGSSGAAKSSAARYLRGLVDPSMNDLRSPPKDERDMMIAAKRSHILAYDNVGHIQPWFSDALCGLSTERAVGTRKLYEDDEEQSFKAARPVILTSVMEVISASDLLSRTLLIELAEMPEAKRTEEAVLNAEFEKANPYLLGKLLDVLAAALARKVRPVKLPRMADFARLIINAEKALGWKAGTFMEDYKKNQAKADVEALAASPVSAAVLRFSEREPRWEGTFERLLPELERECPFGDRDLRAWPKLPRGLSAVLRRIAPNLRRAGVAVEFLEHTREGSMVRLTRTAPVPPKKANQALAEKAARAAAEAVVTESFIASRAGEDLTPEEAATIGATAAAKVVQQYRGSAR